MSYLHIAEQNPSLAGFACGGKCHCDACRPAPVGIGERYIQGLGEEEEPSPSAPMVAANRQSTFRHGYATPCPGNIAVARRTIANAGLGYPPLRTPWRERVMPQPKPKYLKFLSIDHFPFDQPKPLPPPPPPPPFGFTGFSEPVPGIADARKALQAVAEIMHQLGRNFRADDEAGVLDRRQRLREAFNSVPKAFASSLWSRLTDKNDELGKFFRYRLATPTRNEMLAILLRNGGESL